MKEAAHSIDNPYPGLRPFQADETHLFFGRDEQRTELLGRLRKSRFLAVVGTSGSGKSSLVRAGLLPGLYGGFMAGGASRWRIVDTRPGGDPIGRLAAALDLPGALHTADEDDDDISFTEATLRRSSLGLVNVVREAHLPPGERVLLLVDQFEELIRFVDTARTEDARNDASAFVRLLLAAAKESEIPIYVVITMRSDFLGDCARFRGLPEAINDGQYLIPRLTREQRREAITGPASVGGVSLSPTLVNRLLNDVGDTPDQLPILQHALMRTFDHWHAERPDAGTIDLEDYEAVGGMKRALSRHADNVLKGLTENFDSAEGKRRRQIAEKLFKCLTDAGKGGRKVRRLAKLRDIAEVAGARVEEVVSIIDAFRQPGNSFLMPPISEALQPDSYIDISHESLIRNWKKLNKWVDEEAESAEDYRLLAQKAVLHQQGEEDLLGRQALRVANEWKEQQQPTAAWAMRYDPAFETAMEYLARSDANVAARKQAQDRKRRITRTTGFVLFILLATPLLTFVNLKGEEVETISNFAESQQKLTNGGADHLLLSFYDTQSLTESSADSPASYDLGSDFEERFSAIYESDPYYLVDIFYEYGAWEHAEIIERFLQRDRWEGQFGQDLLGAIWSGKLSPETVLEAMERAGEEEQTLKAQGVRLEDLLNQLDAGAFSITPERLAHQLRASGYGAGFDRLVEAHDNAEAPDRLLAEVYSMTRNERIDLAKIRVIKSRFSAMASSPHHLVAEKAVFRAQRRQLQRLLGTPVTELPSHQSELEEMLEVFDFLEVSKISYEPEPDAMALEEGEGQAEPGAVIIEEYIVVDDPDVALAAESPEAGESTSWKSEESPAGLTTDELNSRFDALQEKSEGTDKNPQSAENLQKIAFVWTAKKLLELANSEDTGGADGVALARIRNDRITQSLVEPVISGFTLWKVQDNAIYKNLQGNDLFKSVMEWVREFFYVIGLIFVWTIWEWLQRIRARKGRFFSEKASLLRLGLAGLLDILVAVVVGIVGGLFVAGLIALAVAVATDSFQLVGNIMLATAVLVGAPLFVSYLLLRDVVQFRYRRSVGKILFKLRPVSLNDATMTKGLSAKRNWIILVALMVVPILVGFTFDIVTGLLDSGLAGSAGWQYLLAAAGLIEFLLLLGLFERLGSRWSRTRVLYTRGTQSTDSASVSTSLTPAPSASV